MTVLQLCGVAVCSLALSAVIKRTGSEFSPLVSITSSLCIMAGVAAVLYKPLEYLSSLGGGGAGEYLSVMLKASAVALLTQFTADLCRDMGEGSLGSQIELLGRAEILLLCLPGIKKIVELSGELI